MSSSLSTSPTKLLLVMPYHQLTKKATAVGIETWSLWDPRSSEADLLTKVAESSEELLFTDFSDEKQLRQLVSQCTRRYGIDMVVHCGGGPSVQPIVEEAWRLGLSRNPPEAFVQLQLRQEAPSEVPRVSVQTLTVDGRHHVVGVTAQRTSGPPDFVLKGHLHPAPLSDMDREAVERSAVDLLRSSNYRFGPAHTEVALMNDGAQVLCCRPQFSPDRVPLLPQVASGFDWEEAFFEALLGKAPRIPRSHQYAEIGYFMLPEGQLLTYTGTENIAVTPWVRGARFPYVVGDRTPPAAHPKARRGYVVVEGDSPEHTSERLRQARADLITNVRTVG